MRKLNEAALGRLYRAVLLLKTEQECAAFFEDVCTIAEMQDMAQRLDTALLLDSGKSYQQIVAELGVSSATIGRVNRCLQYGSGGYRTVLDRIAETEGKDAT